MGITGLLPFVKDSCRPANIKDFFGATVAIDAYSWLHKGAFSCAEKLVKGEKTDGYVFYCMKLLNMLLEAGVKPVMVFDGRNLPSKAVTEKKRRENRDKTRQRGKELLCEGKVREARECFQRCVDVTPEMAREVIQACRKKSIDYIVAPYEADAQMAFLDKIGITQLTVTEDSDLILFGCNKILFKMDSCGGGLLFEKENLPKSFGSNAPKFSFEKFRYMCILSGCDYLSSLPGIGLAKAYKFFSLTTITDLNIMLSKLPSYLKMPKLNVSNEYKQSFIKANNTFLYQLVYCPKEKRLVPLNPYPEGVTEDEMEYAGEYLDRDLAYQLAIGNINVKTLKEYESEDFYNSPTLNESKSVLWGKNNSSTENNKSSKRESAFKFNTHKQRVEILQKRKSSEMEDKRDTEMEDLFTMYGGKVKKNKTEESSEDPLDISLNSPDKLEVSASKIPDLESSPKLPLKRIVRSRFFSSESIPSSLESTKSNLSTPSSGYKSANEDFLSNSEKSDVWITNQNSLEGTELKNSSINLDLSKYSNKENILNRFAKKKPSESSPISCNNTDSKVYSTPKEESVLDVFNNESSVATSTISSMQKSAKVLSQSDSIVKIKPSNLFSKKEISKKLISTTIQDYKWTKESNSKSNVNVSLGSDGDSFEESFEESPESPLKEISPYFVNHNDELIPSSSELENSETVITILSDNEDSERSDVIDNSNVIKSVNKSHSKCLPYKNDKLSKCRALGLSKKRKSGGALPRKETLLNFNFTRKSLPLNSS